MTILELHTRATIRRIEKERRARNVAELVAVREASAKAHAAYVKAEAAASADFERDARPAINAHMAAMEAADKRYQRALAKLGIEEYEARIAWRSR